MKSAASFKSAHRAAQRRIDRLVRRRAPESVVASARAVASRLLFRSISAALAVVYRDVTPEMIVPSHPLLPMVRR